MRSTPTPTRALRDTCLAQVVDGLVRDEDAFAGGRGDALPPITIIVADTRASS